MSSFTQIVAFNQAIGNEKGDRKNIDWKLLEQEAKMIQSELNELKQAIKERDINEVRDALCDIHVFAYGTHHKIGYDADDDIHTVVSSLYSRFCTIKDDLHQTIAHHKNKGVLQITVHGEYPFVYIKSAGNYPDAPKGKFLKSINYSKPNFSDE